MDRSPISEISIAAVIPAYNATGKVGEVIDQIPEIVRHIIVVDDASQDSTAEEIAEHTSERVHFLQHSRNWGVGGAMLTGYAYALRLGADVVVKMDADGQMDPDYLAALLQPILQGEADYAKGNRFLNPNELNQMPWTRLIGNVGLTFLTKLSTGYWNIFDPTNGYTAIHCKALELIRPEGIATDYFFETSLLLELRRNQAVVSDVPIPARYRDEVSSMSLSRVLFSFPDRLLTGFLRRIVREYLLYDFNAASMYFTLSAPMLLFGLIWGALKWAQSIRTGIPATTGTVLLAVLPIIVGVQFLTQAFSFDINSLPRRPIHNKPGNSPDGAGTNDGLIKHLEANGEDIRLKHCPPQIAKAEASLDYPEVRRSTKDL